MNTRILRATRKSGNEKDGHRMNLQDELVVFPLLNRFADMTVHPAGHADWLIGRRSDFEFRYHLESVYVAFPLASRIHLSALH